MVDARTKFQVGQKVKLTPRGEDNGCLMCGPGRKLRSKPITGTVVGFSQDKLYVRVLPSGLKTIGVYHPDFWEPLEGGST